MNETHYMMMKRAFWDKQTRFGKMVTLLVFPKWVVIGIVGWIYILK